MDPPSNISEYTSSLKDLKSITSTLFHCIRPMYGAESQQALVVNDSGKIIVSCDGLTIISKLHLSHPLAKLILNSVFSFAAVYKDGTKTFIIYLHEMMMAIDSCYKDHEYTKNEDVYRNLISIQLNRFTCRDLPGVIDNLYELVKETFEKDNSAAKPFKFLSSLIQSYLRTSTVNIETSFFVELGTSFLHSFLKNKMLLLLYDHFDSFVFNCLALPYELSFVQEGLFGCGILYKNCCHDSGKLLCLQYDFGSLIELDNQYLFQSKSDISENLMTHKINVLKAFLEEARALGVSFVLTAHHMPEYVQQLCKAYKISLGVLDDTNALDIIVLLTKCIPLLTLDATLINESVIDVVTFTQICYFNQNYIHICLPRDCAVPIFKSIFVCGPTEGAVSQIVSTLKKSVTAARYCFFSEKEKITDDVEAKSLDKTSFCSRSFTIGCGHFEFLLKECLVNHFSKKDSKDEKLIIQLFDKMLHGVQNVLGHSQVSSLRKNTQNNGCSSKTDFEHNRSYEFFGIDVVPVKIATVYSVIQLTITLLRVNAIIGIKRINHDTEEQASD